MTGTMSLGRTLSVVAISSLLVVRCAAAEKRHVDESARYKNHRTAKNETEHPAANKFPVYPSQVYANLSSGTDYATTEAPAEDAVRLYITPSGKRKHEPTAAAAAARPTAQTSSPPAAANNAPPMYYVTAANSASDHHGKSSPAVHSPAPTSYAVRDTMNFQSPAEDETKRAPPQQSRHDGTKSRPAAWTPSPQQPNTNLLYATTQSSSSSSSSSRDATSPTPTVAKALHSKPFTSVFVPKKMLDGDSARRDYVVRDGSSFRPIAAPGAPFSQHKQPAPLQTDGAENRRTANASRPPLGPAKAPASSYKVEEYAPATERPQPFAYNRVVADAKQDRLGAGEKSKPHDQVKRQEGYDARPQPFGPDDYAYEKPSGYRDGYYQLLATNEDAPPNDHQRWRSPYKPAAGKYEMAVKPPSSLFEYEKPRREYPGASAALFGSADAELTSTRHRYPRPEPQADDANAKEVLRLLLRDMFKSKQQQQYSEVKPKSAGVNEFIDAYFKTSPSNVDFGLDGYDIETDMSCNLRSTKYVSDGQCVTTRPIVEAVCADRCLVYSTSLTSQRQRTSLSASQQVEALHCVDGDVKFLRVQLKCRDGNTLNNIIKVVTNCRCKLHQIQPQMRSNLPIPI